MDPTVRNNNGAEWWVFDWKFASEADFKKQEESVKEVSVKSKFAINDVICRVVNHDQLRVVTKIIDTKVICVELPGGTEQNDHEDSYNLVRKATEDDLIKAKLKPKVESEVKPGFIKATESDYSDITKDKIYKVIEWSPSGLPKVNNNNNGPWLVVKYMPSTEADFKKQEADFKKRDEVQLQVNDVVYLKGSPSLVRVVTSIDGDRVNCVELNGGKPQYDRMTNYTFIRKAPDDDLIKAKLKEPKVEWINPYKVGDRLVVLADSPNGIEQGKIRKGDVVIVDTAYSRMVGDQIVSARKEHDAKATSWLYRAEDVRRFVPSDEMSKPTADTKWPKVTAGTIVEKETLKGVAAAPKFRKGDRVLVVAPRPGAENEHPIGSIRTLIEDEYDGHLYMPGCAYGLKPYEVVLAQAPIA